MNAPRVVLQFMLLALLLHAPLRAQSPGEIMGVVLDAMTSAPIDGVDVTIPMLQRAARSDAAGRFRLTGIEPGEWELRSTRLGYADGTERVAVRNGSSARITIRLSAQPLSLAGLDATTARSGAVGTRIERAQLERMGARTAGDALRGVAGVVVQSSGSGSAETATMRGMSGDAVLVLLDGIPLNDPVSGAADLSLIAAHAIESITVLPGAHSARWGARAAAGVIRIETRSGGAADRVLSLGVGSLGSREAALAWGGGGVARWTVGAAMRTQHGRFAFEQPAEVGGGMRERENADVRARDVSAAIERPLGGGQLDVRLGLDALERGLPGRGYAPSLHARHRAERARAALAWRASGSASALSISVAATTQRIGNADPAPSAGPAWGDTTRATRVETRIEAERTLGGDGTVGAGIDIGHLYTKGTVLRSDAPAAQWDAGMFAHVEASFAPFGWHDLHAAVHARLDRDAVTGRGVVSRSVQLGWTNDLLAMHIAQRSSYSPPTLGDRFFREAVGIEPNPDLRAERVPGELELAASLTKAIDGWVAALRATAYRGDIDGLIVWAPDYRFVWSPRNQDARRVGAETAAELNAPGGRARIAATWTYTRVTYDRGDDDDNVQIAYRPRHAGTLDGAVTAGGTTLSATLRYTGRRTTAPSALNTLPGFWTLDGALSHERVIAGWRIGLDVRVDRVFDEEASLIFGFPEPGRVLRVGVRLSPRPTPTLLTIGSRP